MFDNKVMRSLIEELLSGKDGVNKLLYAFDKEKRGRVDAASLRYAVKMVGYNLTDSEIKVLLDAYPGEPFQHSFGPAGKERSVEWEAFLEDMQPTLAELWEAKIELGVSRALPRLESEHDPLLVMSRLANAVLHPLGKIIPELRKREEVEVEFIAELGRRYGIDALDGHFASFASRVCATTVGRLHGPRLAAIICSALERF